MAGNTFGKHFQITTFGESHGKSIGGIIDGVPAGLIVDLQHIQCELNRRRPGSSELTTPRNESDKVEFLSGLVELDGAITTLGTPIGFYIPNKDAKSSDYDHVESAFRPSHADSLSAVAKRPQRWWQSFCKRAASRVVAGTFTPITEAFMRNSNQRLC